MDRYLLCAVKIGTDTISQITSETFSQQVTELLAADTVGLYNRAAAVDKIMEGGSFTTQMCKTALAAVGTTPVNLATSNAVFYFAKVEEGGGLVAAGAATITMAKGTCVWKSLSAPADGAASVTYEVQAISADGDAAGAVLATGVAMPTIATAELWVVGAGLQSLEIDSGMRIKTDRQGGTVYPTLSSVQLPIQPEIRTVKSGAGALGASGTDDAVTITEATDGGGRGDDITFTWNQATEHVETMGPDTSYRILPTFDGTNVPIVITGIA